MKKKITTLLLVLTLLSGHVQAQRAQHAGELPQHAERDSVLYQTAFHFQYGVGDWIQPKEYGKMTHLLLWAKSDTITPIEITGWADPTGTLEQNDRISLRRVRTIQKYLVKQGIAAHRISFEGRGVDAEASSDEKARRADVRGVIRLAAEPQPAEPAETATATPYIKEEVQLATEQKEEIVQSKEAEPNPTAIEPPTSPWYVGGGIGMAFGRTSFASFAADKTRPGFNVGVLGGYQINKLLSVEVSLDYTRMTLGAYDCCQNLYLGADGNRYFAPITGMTSYRYGDLLSTAHLIGLGAHLNIDLVSIWIDNSRWSAPVSPAIYGVYSSALIKQSGTQVRSENRFHFGAGLDLGAQYRIDGNWSLRLSTGVNYLTGAFDALPREEHKTSYVWNTALKVIYKW